MGRIKKERIKFGFFDVDLEDLNLEELKDYIRDGIDFINDYLEENKDLRKPQLRFLKEIKENTTRGRLGKDLGYGLKMNKDALLSKAEDIEKFIRLSKDYDNERINTAFEQFKRSTSSDVSMEVYKKLVNIFVWISILFNIAYTIWKWYRNAIKDNKIDKNDVDDLMNDLNDIINKKEDE